MKLLFVLYETLFLFVVTLGVSCLLLTTLSNATALPVGAVKKGLSCLLNKDSDEAAALVSLMSLMNGTCLDYDDYNVRNNEYPNQAHFAPEELECLLATPAAPCSATYLCHFHLYHDHSIAAYKSALLALEHNPLSGPGLSCLAALYFRNNNFLRAAFYSAVSYSCNSTLDIFYSDVGNDRHIHDFLEEKYRGVIFPNYQTLAADIRRRGAPQHLPFADIMERLTGRHTLFTIYSHYLHQIPEKYVGPAITAYEYFLEDFEKVVNIYSPGPVFTTSGVAADSCSLQVCPGDGAPPPPAAPSPPVHLHWPGDKHVNIHYEGTAKSSTYLYSLYVEGLADALRRLGVPHRLSSVAPLQTSEENSVTIYVTERDFALNFSPDLASTGARPQHRYVHWNLRHPAHDRSSPSCRQDYAVSAPCRAATGDSSAAGADICLAALWEPSVGIIFLELESAKRVSARPLPRLVNALCPDRLLLSTKAELHFSVSLMQSDSFHRERDFDRPVDFLFMGLVDRAGDQDRTGVYRRLVDFALEHDLNVKFMLEYEDFTLEEERKLINQAKVVVILLRANIADVCPASSSHHYKVRQLLGMGKAVVSESLSPYSADEVLLSGYVSFAPTENIAEVALALLKQPSARWRMERKAMEFMLSDHLQSVVGDDQPAAVTDTGRPHDSVESELQPSSLSLLADALNDLAVSLWPQKEKAMESSDGDGLTKSEDSVRSESALAWAEKYCKQTSMFLDPYVSRRLGFALHNSSHPCYRRTRERVLLGYLKRRYKLSGNVLFIGCERGKQKYARFGNLYKEFQLDCVFPMLKDIKLTLKEYKPGTLELIFINQEVLLYSFDLFKIVLPLLFRYLNADRGSLIINSIVPSINSIHSDTWRVLIYLKSFADIDCALVNVDNGILVLKIRDNPFLIQNDTVESKAISEQLHAFRYVSPFDHFYHVADSFVPLLDFSQLHSWLSHSNGTKTHTAISSHYKCHTKVVNPHSSSSLPRPITFCV